MHVDDATSNQNSIIMFTDTVLPRVFLIPLIVSHGWACPQNLFIGPFVAPPEDTNTDAQRERRLSFEEQQSHYQDT